MGTGITETNVCQGGKGPYARAERDEQEHGGTESRHFSPEREGRRKGAAAGKTRKAKTKNEGT